MKTLLLTVLLFLSFNVFGEKYKALQKTYVKEVEDQIDSEKVTTRGDFIFEITENIIFLTYKNETLRYPINEVFSDQNTTLYLVQNGWSIKIINNAAIVVRWSDKSYTVYNHVTKL
jgi:hypothetical protein